jgi:DNA-binding transcriptional LysR family regulator
MLSRFSIYFDEVARRGSIREASDRLGIVASAVDRQIVLMEARLGAKLFERTPSGLKLTAAGELMADRVRRWQRETAQLKVEIDELQGLRRGEVSIAVVEGSLAFFGRVLSQFRDKYPAITYSVHVAGTRKIAADILAGVTEIGLTINHEDHPGLRVERNLIYQVGAVVPPAHPLARHEEVTVLECNDYPLIIPHESISLRAIVDQVWMRNAGIAPPAVAVVDSIAAIKVLTKAGLGVALLTPLDILHEISSGALAFIPLKGQHIPLSVLSLISASRRMLSVPASLLLQQIASAMMSETVPQI